MVYRVFQTDEFADWFLKQNLKTQLIVTARIERLVSELKWTSGLRVYTALVDKSLVVILAGGNKNGQSKDIKKAKSLLKEIAEGV